MTHGDQRKKTDADRDQGAGGQSGQEAHEQRVTETGKEGTSVPQVAGAGSEKGMAAALQAAGADRCADRG